MSDTMTRPATKLVTISIDKLVGRDDNLRTDANGDDLVDSIRAFGILQPLNVTASNGHFMVNAGHRRLDGARKAGLTEVPAMVTELSDEQVTAVMLVENLQRADLSQVEQIRGFARLAKLGWKQKEIAERTGFSPSVISRRIKVASLPDEILELIGQTDEYGEVGLTLEDAELLVPLAQLDKEKAIEMAETGYVGGYTVDQAVNRIKAEREVEKLTAKLQKAGLTVVDWDVAAAWRPVPQIDEDGKAWLYKIIEECTSPEGEPEEWTQLVVKTGALDLQAALDDPEIFGVTVKPLAEPVVLAVRRTEVEAPDPEAKLDGQAANDAKEQRARERAKARHELEQYQQMVAGKLNKTRVADWVTATVLGRLAPQEKTLAARFLQLDTVMVTEKQWDGTEVQKSRMDVAFDQALADASGAALSRILLAVVLATGPGSVQAEIRDELGFVAFAD